MPICCLRCTNYRFGIIQTVPDYHNRMYGGLGNSEMLGGRPDGGAVFNNVHSQITGPFLDVVPHVRTS